MADVPARGFRRAPGNACRTSLLRALGDILLHVLSGPFGGHGCRGSLPFPTQAIGTLSVRADSGALPAERLAIPETRGQCGPWKLLERTGIYQAGFSAGGHLLLLAPEEARGPELR